MSFITAALIGGGAAIIGGAMASSGARKAASTQAAAADRAAELSNEQYYQTRQDQAPFREGGLTAQNRLMTLLGLTPSETPSGGGGGGGNVAGMVAGAVQDAMGQPQGSGLQVDRTSPDFGRYARDFGMADFQADPGYAFRLSEGQKALDRQAAARGGLISGGALKAAGRYGQDMASQEFTNAFNRYQTNRSNQLNPLQSLMGAGQTATNFLGTTGAANAANVGEAGMQAANARASGYMGSANALSNALGTGANLYMQSQFMNRMYPQTPSGMAYTTAPGYSNVPSYMVP